MCVQGNDLLAAVTEQQLADGGDGGDDMLDTQGHPVAPLPSLLDIQVQRAVRSRTGCNKQGARAPSTHTHSPLKNDASGSQTLSPVLGSSNASKKVIAFEERSNAS